MYDGIVMTEQSDFDLSFRDQIEEKARAGNMNAIQTLAKLNREKVLREKREELMCQYGHSRPEDIKEKMSGLPSMPTDRGFPSKLDELNIEEIHGYVMRGEFKQLPEHMVVYLKWMEEAHDWYYKFKSRNWVLRYLLANCKDSDGNQITYYLAGKIFNDMMIFFYPDVEFRKNSWLRYLAERLEMGAILALEDNDFETYGKNLERAAKVMDMIKIAGNRIDQRLYDRRPMFFVTSAKQLGIPEVDRNALARQIDEMDITESEKLAAKRDLGVEDRDILNG